MDNIHRLVNFILPVTACNFRCHYCYVRQEERQTGKIDDLDYSPEHIQRCMTKERWGGICHINICGLGETLLADYAVDLAVKMLENGHYVSIVTNGTITERIKELCNISSELKERLFFKFSFHYLELEKRGKIDVFFENVFLVRSCGCAFSVELTVNDESVPYIPTIRKMCREKIGADCHVIESRNNLDGFSRLTTLPIEEHQKLWGQFNSNLFAFQQTQWMKKRNEFCYAGDYITSLNVGSGWLLPCFSGGEPIQNVFKNPNEPIRFAAIGRNCPWSHCYAAYVLMTSGVIPTVKTPTYAEFRNRECEDGTQWLTKTVSEFFSTKIYETNPQYSHEKELYIDILMSHVYNHHLNSTDFSQVAKEVQSHLGKKNIRTVAVAVYGRDDKWIDWFFSLLKNLKIKIKYAVDISDSKGNEETVREKLKHRFKYYVKRWIYCKKEKILLLNKNDYLPKVDLMIVSDYAHATEIIPFIPVIYKNICTVTELMD